MPDDRSIVVLISSDPRVSHRAFEAMRIGVGVVAGDNDVVFVLRGGAVHLLDDDTADLVDGDDVEKFRATLRRLDIPFHVEETALPKDPDWNADRHPVVPMNRERVAELVARARRVLAF